MPWFITPTSPMSETNAASSSNSSQREASTTPSDNTLSQVHSPPNSHGPLTHSDKVHMLILLLQQETGVPIPGTAPNKQRNDVHDVSPRNLLNVEHESGDHITCADTVHVASVPSDVAADGDDNMSVSRCYWADSESNKIRNLNYHRHVCDPLVHAAKCTRSTGVRKTPVFAFSRASLIPTASPACVPVARARADALILSPRLHPRSENKTRGPAPPSLPPLFPHTPFYHESDRDKPAGWHYLNDNILKYGFRPIKLPPNF